MADNKKLKGKQDRSKVDANDPAEVEWLHRKFPKHTHSEIVKLVKKTGPGRKKILKKLKNS